MSHEFIFRCFTLCVYCLVVRFIIICVEGLFIKLVFEYFPKNLIYFSFRSPQNENEE